MLILDSAFAIQGRVASCVIMDGFFCRSLLGIHKQGDPDLWWVLQCAQEPGPSHLPSEASQTHPVASNTAAGTEESCLPPLKPDFLMEFKSLNLFLRGIVLLSFVFLSYSHFVSLVLLWCTTKVRIIFAFWIWHLCFGRSLQLSFHSTSVKEIPPDICFNLNFLFTVGAFGKSREF